MSQPIAGVSPSELSEVTCKVVWPTIGSLRWGRMVGQLSGLRLGFGIFTLGNLFALLTIPLSVTVFCWQLMPFVCRRYAVTNRRIIVRKGLSAVDGPWISLDDFDAIRVEVLPGQAWLHAGDLVFLHNDHEVLRLPGVPRAEVFRQVCLTARMAHQSVRAVVERQAASAA